MINRTQQDTERGLSPIDFGAAVLHALITFLPFAAVFYFFIPLQSYTHWAFRAYYVLVWALPLTGVVHLFMRRETWAERWRIIRWGLLAASLAVTVLTLAWGTYTG